MKTKIYLFIGRLAVLVFVMGNEFMAFTQVTPPGGPPPGGPPPGGVGTDPPCWNPECIPIDGGVGFLIAAGAVLGVKKIRDYKKQ